MDNLLSVETVDVQNKSVLVRADLEWEGEQSPRQEATMVIVRKLQEAGAGRIKILGHKGNIGQVDQLGVDVFFDLRADPREEENSDEFAKELALGFDVYVNEAFATSHRKHTSIVALPQLMKQQGKIVCAGMRCKKEIDVLSEVRGDAKFQNKILVIGGAKAGDKAKYAEILTQSFAGVLRGGLLPGVDLRADGLDLSDTTISEYEKKISTADLIVVAGPMGKYEDESASVGTKRVFEAVATSKAFKIAGGGDTEAALETFGLRDQMDWISVGGGAMLEFLAMGTLPGIEALVA